MADPFYTLMPGPEAVQELNALHALASANAAGAAPISADPGNRTTTGSDGGIYTPEIVADPLAYYILARA